jgi:hypothetical protein
MSQKGVSEVVGILLTCEEFRSKFKADPDTELKAFDLTDEERNSLKKLKDQDIGSMNAKEIAGALAGVISGPTAMAD